MTLPDSNDTARWRVLATKCVYASPWVEICIDNVQLPAGSRVEHHVVKFPRSSVGAVVVDDRDRTLLIWRHRYITDTWGWEIPAGWGDPGEDPVLAASREVEEETGYRPGTIRQMTAYKPMAGVSTMHYTTFVVTNAVQVSQPTDSAETTRVEWIPLSDIPRLADAGLITDGPSLTGLSYYLAVYRQLHSS